MLVTPLPGVNRKNLYDTLLAVATDVSNLWTAGPHGHQERLMAYLEWTVSAVTRLRPLIREADITQLVLTRQYELLLSNMLSLGDGHSVRLTNALVSLELRERANSFETAVKLLQEQLYRWQLRGRPVVADTSFYIHHPSKLEETDFAELLAESDGPVHLVIPMVVVDELDGLKRSKDRDVRWRAAYTLAVLDRLFQNNAADPRLQEPDPETLMTTGVRRGQVTIELLFDPPGHVRLPINDDEIVDRAATIGPLAGRSVTLLTYDTGQASRAANAGDRAAVATGRCRTHDMISRRNHQHLPSGRGGSNRPSGLRRRPSGTACVSSLSAGLIVR